MSWRRKNGHSLLECNPSEGMIIDSKVILRAKRLADAQDDYSWQTDPELAQLDAVPLLTIPVSCITLL